MKKYWVSWDGFYSSIYFSENKMLGDDDADGPYDTFAEAKKILVDYFLEGVNDNRFSLKAARKLRKADIENE